MRRVCSNLGIKCYMIDKTKILQNLPLRRLVSSRFIKLYYIALMVTIFLLFKNVAVESLIKHILGLLLFFFVLWPAHTKFFANNWASKPNFYFEAK